MLSRELAGIGIRRRIPAGTTLYWQGEESPTLYVVARGLFLSTVLSPGGKALSLQYFGPEQVIGTESLIGEGYTATTRSVTASEVLAIGAPDFWRALDSSRGAREEFLRAVLRRLVDLRRRAVALYHTPAPTRVALALGYLSLRTAEEGSAPVRSIRITQEELAEFIGVSRVTVNQVLHRLQAEGTVRLGYGAIELLRPERLVVGEP